MRRLIAFALVAFLVACAGNKPPAAAPPPPAQTAVGGGAKATPATAPTAAAPATKAGAKAGAPVAAPARPASAPAPAAGQERPQEGQTPPAAERPAGPGGRQAPPEPRPYERVITKDAKSLPGVFTVHRVKETVYYEIPKAQLDKDFLWVSQIARTTLGVGYGGQAAGNRVVRWVRRDNRVLLEGVSYEVVADQKQPIARAVLASETPSIIMAFNVEAFGKDEAPVIDVTRLFTSEVPEFSARTRLRASGFDQARSFVDRVAAFPENIEVEATQTFTAQPPSPTAPVTPAPAPMPGAAAAMRPGSATIVMHYSMLKLPEKPMMPRLYDERVGYFSIQQMDYGQDEHRAPRRTYITRWRLEKKDPTAAVSEPVKPITFYVDPATPTKWVPWIKRAIEDWQPAFEEAGFRRGIVAREAPANDPDWSPEDARYSVIRWLPSTIENAMGPHISDPRTGEILEADIQIYHNVMNLARDWYFVQAGPLDPRAKTLPLPDELMGRIIEYVVAHEIGHSLGFQHNFKASSLYPIEKIRDREWVKTMGHVPSIMDYSRFNYVAQPEDRIDPNDLIPRIGPYDKWATMWGYKPVPGAQTPDAEKKTLGEWARQQDETAWYRFNTEGAAGSDPGEQSEAVGDIDAIQASTLGAKNLARVMDMMLPATTHPGEPWDDLEELYGRALGQWVLEMNHVVPIVGGFSTRQLHAGQQGLRFTLVPHDRQAAAVKFLNDHAFATPKMFVRPEILRRIGPTGVVDQVRTSQQRVLTSLLSPTRFSRLVEQEALDGAKAYRPTEFMSDVRKGVWSEIDAPRVTIDIFRRNLQRSYLEALNDRLNGRQPATDEARAVIRGELRELDANVRLALPRAAERATRLHLQDARDRIAQILDPKFAQPVPAGATLVRPALSGVQGPTLDDRAWPEGANTCWPDYIIRPKK
jgi:hypothetical protein